MKQTFLSYYFEYKKKFVTFIFFGKSKKKMKKVISYFFHLIFLLFLVLSFAEAEEPQANKTKQGPFNRIGLTASTISGFGLTYYRHFDGKFVGKISFFAYGTGDEKIVIFGSEVQYNLKRTKTTRFHVFVGFSYWHWENIYLMSSADRDNSEIEKRFLSGGGAGFEFLAWNVLSFNIEAGVMYNYSVTTTKYQNSEYPDYQTKTNNFGIGFGLGITYAF